MLKLSLLLVAAVLLNRKLHQDFGWVCVSAVMAGYFWPTWLLLPYVVIVWRISKNFLESGRVSQTKFPLFIGRRRSSLGESPKPHHQSADWIVAIEVPPEELFPGQGTVVDSPNKCGLNSSVEDDKIHLVTKAVPKVSFDGSRKQLLKSKSELSTQNYHLQCMCRLHGCTSLICLLLL